MACRTVLPSRLLGRLFQTTAAFLVSPAMSELVNVKRHGSLLDGDMPQYIADNTDDEISHHRFLNNYLASKGAKTFWRPAR
jgi:hypothetical protein